MEDKYTYSGEMKKEQDSGVEERVSWMDEGNVQRDLWVISMSVIIDCR